MEEEMILEFIIPLISYFAALNAFITRTTLSFILLGVWCVIAVAVVVIFALK